MILKKEKVTVVGIILLILAMSTGCGRDKDMATGGATTGEEIAGQEASREEFFPICTDHILFSVNEKGEKVGEFHEDKVAEILGLDKDDRMNMLTCSDKVVICSCYDSEKEGKVYYAVNEGSGKSVELKGVCYATPYIYSIVDYYKGDFYFTYDDKELICSIEDSLEYVVKEADLADFYDKLGNKTVIRPRADRSISTTRLLDEVGYALASSEYQREFVMIQKDGTVTELPQLGAAKDHILKDYDNKGIVYDIGVNGDKVCCIKLDTMEENVIPHITPGTTCYPMKNGKLCWFSSSDQDKDADVRAKYTYHVYDVESNSDYVLAETNKRPGTAYYTEIGNDLCVCGDNIFIIDVADDKKKWFRVDKEGDNTLLTDMDLTIETINSLKYGTVKYEDGTYNCPSCRKKLGTFYKEYFILRKEYSEHAEDINADLKEDFTYAKSEEIENGLEWSSHKCEVNSDKDEIYELEFDTTVNDVDIINDRYLAVDMEREYWCLRGVPPQEDNYQLLYDLETGKRLLNKDIFKGSEDEFKDIVARAIRNFAENEIQEDARGNLDEIYQYAYEGISIETADLSYEKDYVIVSYAGEGLPYSRYPFCIEISYQDLLGKDTLEID